MRKIFHCTFAALAIVGITSCDDSLSKAKTFGDKLASDIKANNLEAVRSVYPDASLADSLGFAIENIDVEVCPGEKDGEYILIFADGVNATVVMSEDGTFSVVNSTGLFAYPKSYVKLANETGAVKGNINDANIAAVMKNMKPMMDYLYEEYNSSRKDAIKLGDLVITKDIEFMMDLGKAYYPIENTLNEEIKGNEYTVTWENEEFNWEDQNTSYKTEKGIDLSPKGTGKIEFEFTGRYYPSIKSVKVDAVSMEEFLERFKAKGDEYARYMEERGPIDESGNTLGKESMTFAGKLGGKYPIHLTIGEGFKSGSYYYDKYGPSNPLKLTVISFNPKNGKIKLEEFTDQGRVTGEFTGVVSKNSFEGEMDAYNGKTHAFSLSCISE